MAILTEIEGQKAEASSSFSGKVAAGTIYDVFISFRGEDTRNTFTDFLYYALLEADIDTFLDDREIETGDELKPELERAIQQSRASIIVLSKNYASSTWCLNELVMILERKKTSNHIVLPIFYHVDPSDVRKLQNSFAEAMAKHNKRIDAETNHERKSELMRNMEHWKKALTEVAGLKAMVAQGSERKFIQDIVMEIDRRLARKHIFSTPRARMLIGMEAVVDEINSWLQDESSSVVDILTVCGIGGIGKTSLVKHIYETNFQEFGRRSFLEDIGRSSTQPGHILGLQKQLLGDIRKGKLQEIRGVNMATTMIEKSLCTTRVFLVLDDVNEVDQLNALLGAKGFYPGSKIIITTKDKLLVRKCEVFNLDVSSKNYREHILEGLKDQESLELLSWHAFRCKHPMEGYEELSREVVEYCGGHPLTLKVLGSSLFKRDVAAWEDTIQLLGKDINSQIHNVLKISFDSLETRNDKELFKHIACFFVGKERNYAEIILKECDLKTSSGIPNLIDRCLLTIGPFNELRMHQLIQEMGREMVRQESHDPGNRSIVWSHEESFDMLTEEKGTSKIKGLILDMQMLDKKKISEYITAKNSKHDGFLQRLLPKQFKEGDISSLNFPTVTFKTEAFTRMDKLALLELRFVRLTGSYENFPKYLKWLSWYGFALESIPSNFPMGNLVALDMSYSKLKRLWKTPKGLGSLKILDLSHSYDLLRTPNFSGLRNLEILILARCISLVEICETIGKLDKLVLLDMRYCKKLKKLPRNIGMLKSLRSFLIEGCLNLGEFPFELKNMESLETLSADNIGINTLAIATPKAVPRSTQSSLLSLPRSLLYLSLQNSNLSNKSFPMDFSSLPLLKELNLSGNPIDSLPICIRNHTGLEDLRLNSCRQLKSVLCLPKNIKELQVSDCTSLEKITLESALSMVPAIVYSNTDQLTEIQGIFKREPIAKIAEEIINNLGWSNLEFARNLEVQMFDEDHPKRQKKLPIQVLYEFGVFSTFFPGKEVPKWLTYKNNGTSISFIVPPSPKNHSIQGLNVCFVHTFSDDKRYSNSITKISNATKNLTWVYQVSTKAVKYANEDMVWLSHWPLGSQLEDGNNVTVSIGEPDGVYVTECAISLVYNTDKREEKEMYLDYSWKHMIGGDLSAFELTTGEYVLMRRRFHDDPYFIDSVYGDDRVIQNLVGPEDIEYKDERAWDELVYDDNLKAVTLTLM